MIYLSEINASANINTTINVIYHSCFCNLTVNESHLQNILNLLATGPCSADNNNLSLSQNFELGSDILSKSSF